MSEDIADKYEDLRHLIINAMSPGWAALALLDFEELCTAKQRSPRQEWVDHARRGLEAAHNPSPLATPEQLDFCRRALQAMEKFRAIHDAGWKTPVDEGREAFDLQREIEGRPQQDNPYPQGSDEYDWWEAGMSGASEAAYEGGKIPEVEEDRMVDDLPTDTLETLQDRFIEMAKRQEYQFLAVFTVGGGEHFVCGYLRFLLHDVPQFPADLKRRLEPLIDDKTAEVDDFELERTITLDEKIEQFQRFIEAVREVFVELEQRQVQSPIGILRGDPLLIWSRLHAHNRAEYLLAEKMNEKCERQRVRKRKRR